MKYHLIGIKGSGMAGLAQILHDQGHHVQGSDYGHFVYTQDTLIQKGIQFFNFNQRAWEGIDEVIVGHSFYPWHPEVQQALNLKIPVYEYNEFIGKLVNQIPTISIAGSHGKTTTTGWVSSMLETVYPISYLIGDGSAKSAPKSRYFILESCEYKRHFLSYYPTISVILNVDLDHTDYFHSFADYESAFKRFVEQTKDVVIVNGDDGFGQIAKQIHPHVFTYGCQTQNDLMIQNIKVHTDSQEFDVFYHNEFYLHLHIPYIGRHWICNALATISVAIQVGLNAEQTIFGMNQFHGTKRRFKETIMGDDVMIDDYAHHPSQIKATLQSVREKYAKHRVIAIYQPDRYSRLWSFYSDIANALSLADASFIVPFPSTSVNDTTHVFDESIVSTVNPQIKVLKTPEVMNELVQSPGPTVFVWMSSKDMSTLQNLLSSQRSKQFDKTLKND